MQQLANGIVTQVLGNKAMTTTVGKTLADPDNDEKRPLFEGRAVLAVFPLASLQQVSPPIN
jgi:hypothetical protein